MLSLALVPLVLASAATAGVHRLKLHKMPHSNPEHVGALASVAQLGAKYGVQSPINSLSRDAEDNLYWTQVGQQESLSTKGPHTVPLTSMFHRRCVDSPILYSNSTAAHRLRKCPVLCRDNPGNPTTICKFRFPASSRLANIRPP